MFLNFLCLCFWFSIYIDNGCPKKGCDCNKPLKEAHPDVFERFVAWAKKSKFRPALRVLGIRMYVFANSVCVCSDEAMFDDYGVPCESDDDYDWESAVSDDEAEDVFYRL